MKQNKLLGKKVKLIWADACGGQNIDKTELKNISPKNLLVITETYGVFNKEDERAVMIIKEDSEDTVDYTVIPKEWVLEITELK